MNDVVDQDWPVSKLINRRWILLETERPLPNKHKEANKNSFPLSNGWLNSKRRNMIERVVSRRMSTLIKHSSITVHRDVTGRGPHRYVVG